LTTDERQLPGIVPRWEIPGWRERFGVVAGITGRGDGPEPFDLGLWTTAPVGEVMARWRAFRASVPECPAQVLAHQIHGDRVLWHGGPSAGWTLHDGADGHATATPGLLLLVTVADCVPVYLFAPRTRTIALLHAGWRGTAAGILARGVALLQARSGEAPDHLVMHLGVSISGPCYEVGAEVMAGVGEPHPGEGPWHLDIREVLARQAAALGIGEVTRSGRCSAREAAAFFSHRRSGGRDGRMVAYLGIPSP
jgi:YfiH family protein